MAWTKVWLTVAGFSSVGSDLAVDYKGGRWSDISPPSQLSGSVVIAIDDREQDIKHKIEDHLGVQEPGLDPHVIYWI